MKSKTILTLAATILVGAAFADAATISDVTVRQLWPWSGDVDIGFTVSGTNTAVKFMAQYDGVEPFELKEHDLTGDFFNAAPGRCHVRWSPARAGLDGDSLPNFRILSVTPDATDHTYMILNLVDGSYTFAADEPEGGWLANPEHYQTKMVFRRIPAGTATLGLTKALKDKLGTAANTGRHTATISSDYYLAVFPATGAQNYYVTQRAAGNIKDVSSYTAKISDTGTSYDGLRGTPAGDNIDWPNTKYAVAEGSTIAAYRRLVAGTFSADWNLDLPTVVQWEYAARATTPTDQLWSVGGTVDDSFETYTNCLDQIATWYHNQADNPNLLVGQNLPNGWGLYDMVGLCYEWNLDWFVNSTTYYSGTDPVGPKVVTDKYRSRHSGNNSKITNWGYLTTAGIGSNGANSKHYYRLCIHLKSLFK